MQHRQKPIALITGASRGLGATFAHQLAVKGYDLVLLARHNDDLDHLQQSLVKQCNCQIIVLDLADFANPDANYSVLPTHIDLLICNAGYGLGTTIENTDFHVIRQQIDVMILGHMALIKHYLPIWLQRGQGTLIMVASLAAIVTHPGPLYGAIKAYQHHFTLDFHARYRHLGLHAMTICPGLIRTHFHQANQTEKQYQKIPNIWWLTADEVVKKTLKGLKRKKTFMIIGWQNKLIYGCMSLMPMRWCQWLTNRLAQKTTI